MTRRVYSITIGAIVTMLLSACAPYNYYLVDAKPQTTVKEFGVVDPQIQWSRMTQGKVEIWTVDSPSLQAVRFYKGFEDGDKLLSIQANGSELPVYRRDMRATEVMEFFVDSLTVAKRVGLRLPNLTADRIAAENLRPYDLSGQEGFRFEIRFVANNGLEYDGFVVGARIDEKLYLVSYTGTRQYYYPKYKETVENLIASIRIPA